MKRFYQVANIVSLMFALVLNFLVGTQVLNVPSISEISNRYATLLTPATYAFSIWSVIYILLILFVIYQARDLFRSNSANTLPESAGFTFIVASIMNGLWTYFFVVEQIGLSFIILFILVASLFVLLSRLNIARTTPTIKTVIFVWWPLLLYTGWVLIALIVNAASLLNYIGVTISPLGAIVTLITLFIGLLYLLVTRNTRELLFTSAWGIIAIGVQQMQMSEGNKVVMMAAFGVGMAILISTFVHGLVQWQAGKKPISI